MSEPQLLERETIPLPLPKERPESYVQRVTKASGTSFYYAFLTLPRPRRDAIFTVYAFCRAVDCAVDEARNDEQARRQLAHWASELNRAFEGGAQEPIAIRVGEVSRAFSLPRTIFEQIIEGVAYDLAPRRFETFEDLGRYCDLVAGAVGRLCVRIFGHAEAWADAYAIDLGRALQLTNILRDNGPDARRGRFYLPLEDLARHGLDEAAVLSSGRARIDLLCFQAERAESYFRAAHRAVDHGGRSLVAAEIMGAIYHRLLQRLVAEGFPASGPIVRVPRGEKLLIAARTWLRMRLPGGHRL